MSWGPEEFSGRVTGAVRLGTDDQQGAFDEPTSATFHRSADGRSFRVRADSRKFPGFWAEARLSVQSYTRETNTVQLKVQSSGGRLNQTAKVVAGFSDDGTCVIFREDDQYMPNTGCGADVDIPQGVRDALLAYHSTQPLQ